MAVLVLAFLFLAGLASSSAAEGKLTTIEEYPSLVQVENRAALLWLQFCAGSVLTSHHILSTARCFSGPNFTERTRRIRAGTSSRGSQGIIREVFKVYLHPSFGRLGNDGDLSVVRLETALTLDSTIQQAPILGEGISLPDGLKLQLVGWGTTSEGGNLGDRNLYELDVYTVSNDDCSETYLELDNVVNNTITDNMICSGLLSTKGRDLDSRDEGAPLFYTGITVGIVSFGVSNGEDSVPLVSTAISPYTTWIVETAK